MPRDNELVGRHFDALIDDAKEAGVPRDVVGRILMQRVVDLWLETRSSADVASELRFQIDHLDGVVFLSRMSPLKRDLAKRKIRKLQKAGDWEPVAV